MIPIKDNYKYHSILLLAWSIAQIILLYYILAKEMYLGYVGVTLKEGDEEVRRCR